MNTKYCSRCKHDLPLSSFGRNRSTKDGLAFYCKICVSEMKRAKYTPSPRPEFPEGHRDCTSCKNIKPFSEFKKDKKGRFGLNSVCKECRSTAKEKPQAPEGYRFCTQCNDPKPFTAEYFRRDSRTQSGLASLCRECARKDAKERLQKITEENPDHYKERYWKDPEKHRAQGRANYRKHYEKRRAYMRRYDKENREEKLARDREYARTHREEARERAKRWRQENPERYREYNQQWAEENPEKFKAMQQAMWVRRRARKQQLPHDLTVEEWEYCLEYWEHACAVCGDDETIHADHWVPLSHDECPGTVVDNMIPLCQHCNSTKHARDAELWLVEKFGEETATEVLDAVETFFDHVVTYFDSES